MTAHSFCMLQRGHYKQVKSPLKYQLPPYVGAGPLARYGILHTTRGRNTKAVIVLLLHPGLTETAPVNTDEDFVHGSPYLPVNGNRDPTTSEQKTSKHHCEQLLTKFMICSPLHRRDEGTFIQLKVRKHAVT